MQNWCSLFLQLFIQAPRNLDDFLRSAKCALHCRFQLEQLSSAVQNCFMLTLSGFRWIHICQ